MRAAIATTMSEMEALAGRWAALADQVGARHCAQPFWCTNWWAHLGCGRLHVVTVESDGALLALAPLYRERHLGVDRIRLLGSTFGPVSEMLVMPGQPEAEDLLWATVLDDTRWVADLHGYRDFAGDRRPRRPDDVRHWRAEIVDLCRTIGTTGSVEAYLDDRPASLKRKFRRAERAAQEKGADLEIIVVTDLDGVDRHLEEVGRVFEAGEASNPRLQFLSGEYRPFTLAALRAAAAEQRLALFLLRVGGEPAASAFGYRSGTTLSYSAPRFDPRFGWASPGHQILRAMVEHAFRTELTEIDLLHGDLAYKREWSDGHYDLLRLMFSRSAVLHAVYQAAVRAKAGGFRGLLGRSTSGTPGHGTEGEAADHSGALVERPA